MSFESITLNLDASPANIRLETLEGVDYTVVPAVMIVEGVLNGSQGPLLYSAKEMGKTPQVWNNKPVVVNHPTVNGASISACTPIVLETRKVGLIMNTELREKPYRLGTEVWLQMDKLKKVDNRLHTAVENGEAVEVSTGLFTDSVLANGNFAGKDYGAIATNFRPDHLALLPDEKGACSIDDGAGLTANAMSFTKIELLIRDQLAKDEDTSLDTCGGPWVKEVYPDIFIYSDRADNLYQQSYTVNQEQTAVTFDGGASLVVQEYRTPSGEFVANSATPKPLEDSMTTPAKKPTENTELNEDGTPKVPATEPTANTLETPTVPKLDVPNTVATVTTTEFVANTGDTVPTAAVVPAAPQTVEQYVANAPAAIQDVLSEGILAHARDKEILIKSITDNAKNVFTAEQLALKNNSELRALSALAAPEASLANPSVVANYAGATAAPATAATTEEPLGLPVMNFDNDAK